MTEFSLRAAVKFNRYYDNSNPIVKWLIENVGLDNCYWMYTGNEMHVFFHDRGHFMLFQLTWNG